MNLAQSYSLNSGQKLKTIEIFDRFFPNPLKKYITFHSTSKDSKNYDHWQSVINILLPIFQKNEIQIIQIGGKDDKQINGVVDLRGKTEINQVAFIVKNSLLHLGVDSFPCHLAGKYNIPLVSLYSNNYAKNVCPFWGDKSKQIFLEPERKDTFPSYSLQESPKTINTILPETIANSVCKLLNLDFDFHFKTIDIGAAFEFPMIENIPDQAVDLRRFNITSIVQRMDILFNEEALFAQFKSGRVSIITNKPINKDLLTNFKSQIDEIFYILEEENDPTFAAFLSKFGIKWHLLSWLPTDKLNEVKLKYFDFGIIHQKTDTKPDCLKDVKIENLFYKSQKFTLSKGKIYQSLAAMKEDKSVNQFAEFILPVIDNQLFWRENEHFYFLEKI